MIRDGGYRDGSGYRDNNRYDARGALSVASGYRLIYTTTYYYIGALKIFRQPGSILMPDNSIIGSGFFAFGSGFYDFCETGLYIVHFDHFPRPLFFPPTNNFAAGGTTVFYVIFPSFSFPLFPFIFHFFLQEYGYAFEKGCFF